MFRKLVSSMSENYLSFSFCLSFITSCRFLMPLLFSNFVVVFWKLLSFENQTCEKFDYFVAFLLFSIYGRYYLVVLCICQFHKISIVFREIDAPNSTGQIDAPN